MLPAYRSGRPGSVNFETVTHFVEYTRFSTLGYNEENGHVLQ